MARLVAVTFLSLIGINTGFIPSRWLLAPRTTERYLPPLQTSSTETGNSLDVVASAAKQLSTSELKASILRGVSRAARDPRETAQVVDLICLLEERNPTPKPTSAAAQLLLDGPWSLIATYPTDRALKANQGSDATGAFAAMQALSDGVYETLYKNARWSWLAGAARGSGSTSNAGDNNDSLQPTNPETSARSFQNIDVSRRKVFNVVEFGAVAGSSDSGPSGCITVTGSAQPISDTTLEVIFEESSFELNPPRRWPFSRGPPIQLTLPLPRPKGFVEVTFLDESMRVSRGSRRNLFLTVRPKSQLY